MEPNRRIELRYPDYETGVMPLYEFGVKIVGAKLHCFIGYANIGIGLIAKSANLTHSVVLQPQRGRVFDRCRNREFHQR